MGNKKINLKRVGIRFTHTALGEPVFVKLGATCAEYSIRSRDYSPKQLRAIADYIENNPKCILYDDGSGADSYQFNQKEASDA
jgi:hypothetical protein